MEFKTGDTVRFTRAVTECGATCGMGEVAVGLTGVVDTARPHTRGTLGRQQVVSVQLTTPYLGHHSWSFFNGHLEHCPAEECAAPMLYRIVSDSNSYSMRVPAVSFKEANTPDDVIAASDWPYKSPWASQRRGKFKGSKDLFTIGSVHFRLLGPADQHTGIA